jgi:hypothetical protein
MDGFMLYGLSPEIGRCCRGSHAGSPRSVGAANQRVGDLGVGLSKFSGVLPYHGRALRYRYVDRHLSLDRHVAAFPFGDKA